MKVPRINGIGRFDVSKNLQVFADGFLYLFFFRKIRPAAGYPQHMGYEWLNCGGNDAIPDGVRIFSSSKNVRAKYRFRNPKDSDP